MRLSPLLLPLVVALVTLPFFGGAEEKPLEDEIAEIFAEVEAEAFIGDKGPDLNRTRGQIVFEAEHGRYENGGHFGKWHWPDFTGDRWGRYMVNLTYASRGPKLGFQFYIGDQKAKGYIPQSGSLQEERTAELNTIYIPDRDTYPVGILSGDDSNGANFKLRRVTLVPTAEGEPPIQGIDGTVTLAAGEATTFARTMRYEPKESKDCLGYWTDEKDWAEWVFEVHDGGSFRVDLHYGCGGGNHGSDVALWVNDERFQFQVEDTGGFQSWKAVDLGRVELGQGEHRVVIKPVNKTGKAVLDVSKVVLTPLDPAA